MIGKVTFLTGIHQGKSFYFQHVLAIGRNPSNDVQLPFPSVSREHARISLSGSGGVVKDLKSTGGTFVNGRIVMESAALKSGDKIRISSFEMTFEMLEDSAVDPNLIIGKGMDFISPEKSTATGFIDAGSLNLSEIEEQIRE